MTPTPNRALQRLTAPVSQPMLPPPSPRRLGGRVRIQTFIFFVGVALILAAAYPWSPSVNFSPQARQMSIVGKIIFKIRQYDLDHPASETDDLKTKSIDDFVAMNVLTADDAAYLREHEVTFYGYDPNHIGSDVPVFDTIYKNGKTRKRIIGYSNGSVSFSPIEPAK